jgi:ABC-type uncharacterized transport system substrate-binding protein
LAQASVTLQQGSSGDAAAEYAYTLLKGKRVKGCPFSIKEKKEKGQGRRGKGTRKY